MVMTHKQMILFTLISLFLIPTSWSWARVGLDLYGVGSYSMATASQAITQSEWGYTGGGLGLAFPISFRLSFDINALYYKRVLSILNAKTTTSLWEGQVGFRCF